MCQKAASQRLNFRLGSIANRRRLEVQPFDCSSPKPPAVIRRWPLPSGSALLEEVHGRQLTKYISRWARKSPATGMGRKATGVSSDSSPESG